MDEIPTPDSLVPTEPEEGLPSHRVSKAALLSAAFFLVPSVALVMLFISVLFMNRLSVFEGESAPAFEAFTSTFIVEVAVIVLIAMLVRVFYGESLLVGMRWSRGYSIRPRALFGMGTALAVMAILVSALFPPSDPPPLQELMDTPQAIVLFGIFAIAAAPFLEELVFRGFYYRVLEDVGGPGVAIPGTAVLFASLHVLQLWGSWPAILMILVVGCLLSWLRWRTRSLIPSFIVHTAYNSMIVLISALLSAVAPSVE